VWDIIKNGLIMAAYSLIAGAALAFVYMKTAPVIEAQKEARTGDTVMLEVLPGMSGGFEKKGEEGGFQYWIGYRDSGRHDVGGYVFIVLGNGYTKGVPIETMVGVDPDGVITGVKILFQQETPGLGDKIQEIKAGESEPWFTRQFVGKSTADDLRVKKDGGVIDAISGATISSRAVTESIRNGLLALEAALSGREFVPPPTTEAEEEEPEEKPITMPTEEQIAEVFPGMAGGYEIHDEESDFPYWTAYKDAGRTAVGGYLFIAREEGFASMIETLVGVDADGRIVGLKILSQEETPEYGGRMEEIREGEDEPWFPRQFIGKSADDTIALKADGGDIDAITDATISSAAFTKSIAVGLKHLKAALSGEEFVPEEDEGEDGEEETVAVQPEEAFEDVLPAMFGGYEIQDEDSDFPYWIAYRDPDKSEIGGYLFVAEGEGFASTIETLVAVDPDLTIIGIKVLYHEETEGWGDKLDEIREGEDEPWFPRQFIGKSADDTIALKADGGDIDALTEATITSRGFTESVSEGLKKLSEKIR